MTLEMILILGQQVENNSRIDFEKKKFENQQFEKLFERKEAELKKKKNWDIKQELE